MYLSMLFIIIAAIFQLGNFYGFIALSFFILTITQFQIKPEERIIEKILVKSIVSIKRRFGAGYSLVSHLSNKVCTKK
jgi:hypothetical protein